MVERHQEDSEEVGLRPLTNFRSSYTAIVGGARERVFGCDAKIASACLSAFDRLSVALGDKEKWHEAWLRPKAQLDCHLKNFLDFPTDLRNSFLELENHLIVCSVLLEA